MPHDRARREPDLDPALLGTETFMILGVWSRWSLRCDVTTAVPTFSIVVCTHKRSGRVVRAISSVLEQAFEDFELIVVDDGSVDDTRHVVTAIVDPRLRYVYRENGGLSAARNTGVAKASGRFVTFLDDDDEGLPTWLAAFNEALAGGDAVASCGVQGVDESGRERGARLPSPMGAAYEGYRGLFMAGTFALPRLGYEAIGDFAEDLPCSNHSEFALRLLPYCRSRRWPVRTIDQALVRYEVRPNERRSESTPGKVLVGTRYVLHQHEEQLARSPDLLANTLARAGVASARAGDYREARRFLARAMRANPRNGKHVLRLGLACVPRPGNAVWKARRYQRLTPELG